MSHVFWDHYIDLDELEHELKALEVSREEKEELWRIIDEIVHHRMMGCVLEKLPRDHHEDFLEHFHQAPHDLALADYLTEKIKEDIGEVVKKEVAKLKAEILAEMNK